MAVDLQTMRDDYLEYIEEDIKARNTEGFQIADDAAADWAIRKIAQAQQRIEARKRFVEAEQERLRQWQEAEDAKDKRTIEFMTGLLRQYFERLRESGALGKRKSYVLPHGRLQMRSVGHKWMKVDEQELTKWAESRGLIRVKVEPAWSEIAKNLRPSGEYVGAGAVYVDPETGEMFEVPGVVLESPAGESFSVSPDLGEVM